MSKVYWVAFGGGNPQTYKGLAPTFISFCKFDGTTLTPPSITEPVTNQGLYAFTLVPSFPIAFIIDGATTGLATADRFVFGSVDPIDMINETGQTLIAMGSTTLAGLTSVGQTILAGLTLVYANVGGPNIGSTASSYGTNLVDPVDLFGYQKRFQELLEGNETYSKSTGVLNIYSRGSSQLLRTKTITNDATGVTKS